MKKNKKINNEKQIKKYQSHEILMIFLHYNIQTLWMKNNIIDVGLAIISTCTSHSLTLPYIAVNEI